MRVVYTARHKLHATDAVEIEGHPLDADEVPARAEIILSAAQTARLGPLMEPVDHGLDPILTVHDPDFVAFLRTAHAESAAIFGEPGPVMAWSFAPRGAVHKPKGLLGLKGYYAFAWGTPILSGTWEAAYWSAQCALTAADRLLTGEAAAYALCRPPGHHAAADLYGGFCYLNNAAIAARHLQQSPLSPSRARGGSSEGAGGAKIAILDVDYHHGNGTQAIFYADPSVLYCSLHAHPNHAFPHFWGAADERGAGPGTGFNRNWPLPPGTGDPRYLAALDEAMGAIRAFAPRYLIVSAGLDVVTGDPLGSFNVTAQGLREIGKRIAALNLPTAVVQEGGYRLDTLGQSAVAFLQPFVERK
jgi:acetoin utilization deacetylase AcuC-like enzyme